MIWRKNSQIFGFIVMVLGLLNHLFAQSSFQFEGLDFSADVAGDL